MKILFKINCDEKVQKGKIGRKEIVQKKYPIRPVYLQVTYALCHLVTFSGDWAALCVIAPNIAICNLNCMYHSKKINILGCFLQSESYFICLLNKNLIFLYICKLF